MLMHQIFNRLIRMDIKVVCGNVSQSNHTFGLCHVSVCILGSVNYWTLSCKLMFQCFDESVSSSNVKIN